ncbi:hypothetical protein DL93DRAFT_164168 [Clavulina sp. PMI_390]|nr:hypothetical protein DL93DRAFT_164168 [Clavulina sp. PMI_390]
MASSSNGSVNPMPYSQLIGIILGSFLFGIITVQTMLYYHRFPRDSWGTRWVVGWLWLMQAFESGVSSYAIYQILITSQINFELLVIQPWYRSYFATHTTVTGFTVQSFFLWRYWSVSRNRPVTILLGLLVLNTLGFAIYISVRSFQFPDSGLATLEGELWASKFWLSFSAATDVVLAAALVIEMRRQHTGYSRTDSLLNRLAIYGVGTGGVTATAVIADLFTSVVARHYEGFALIGLPLGGLYIATFLANLHTRSALRTIVDSQSLELSTTTPRTFGPRHPPILMTWERSCLPMSALSVQSKETKKIIVLISFCSDNFCTIAQSDAPEARLRNMQFPDFYTGCCWV